MVNEFHIETYDGDNDGKLTFITYSKDNGTLVIVTPDGKYRIGKQDLRTAVNIMNSMDKNQEGYNNEI